MSTPHTPLSPHKPVIPEATHRNLLLEGLGVGLAALDGVAGLLDLAGAGISVLRAGGVGCEGPKSEWKWRGRVGQEVERAIVKA